MNKSSMEQVVPKESMFSVYLQVPAGSEQVSAIEVLFTLPSLEYGVDIRLNLGDFQRKFEVVQRKGQEGKVDRVVMLKYELTQPYDVNTLIDSGTLVVFLRHMQAQAQLAQFNFLELKQSGTLSVDFVHDPVAGGAL